MPKTRINISTDTDLAEFIKLFAAENRTTVADIISQYLLSIKRRVESEAVEDIFANPVFHQAMENAQLKLQNGLAKWHTYNEVFGR
jgi:hypothetical protein